MRDGLEAQAVKTKQAEKAQVLKEEPVQKAGFFLMGHYLPDRYVSGACEA